jgi:hypothetical protein
MTDPVSMALERLYGAELDAFLAQRKQLVAELRGAGNSAAAKAVASAPKPTRTAWALNQVARRSPELLQALLRAREEAATPPSGDADGLRQAMRDYRDRVADVVRAARDRLAESGMDLNAEQSRRIGETLQATCAEPGEARDRLMAGTLSADVVVEDPFAGIAGDEGPAAALRATEGRAPAKATPKGTADVDLERRREQERREREREQREKALAAARVRVAELEETARDARTRARSAEATAERATREADRARQAADDAEASLDAARKELGRLAE